jgi:hypothetical protein
VPSVDRRQARFATAEQVESLIAKLEAPRDRALWAVAIYAGLRQGEITALHRDDVDLATGVLRVERGWDRVEGEIAPKSRQGRRKVPIPAVLRDQLDAYLPDAPERGRIFHNVRGSYNNGRSAAEQAGVEPPTLHECRHGYASLMIAAGVNLKALSTFMGHANIKITLDQYGHLLPGARTRRPGCWTRSSHAKPGRARTRVHRRLHRTPRKPACRPGPARCTTSSWPAALERNPAELRHIRPPGAPRGPLCGTPIGPQIGPQSLARTAPSQKPPPVNDGRPSCEPGRRGGTSMPAPTVPGPLDRADFQGKVSTPPTNREAELRSSIAARSSPAATRASGSSAAGRSGCGRAAAAMTAGST